MKHRRSHILFIRGFNTDNVATGDTYTHVRQVLSQTHSVASVHYFAYPVHEDIRSVYRRLCATIDEGPARGPLTDGRTGRRRARWTHLIGHSMGGGLLMRFVFDHYTPEHAKGKYRHIEKLMLLMPMVYKDPTLAWVARLPGIDRMAAPKALMLPASRLYTDGNVLNDDYSLLPWAQVVGMVREVLLEEDECVDTLNLHANKVVLLYAQDEAFTTIPPRMLGRIRNAHLVAGLHESFNGRDTSDAFCTALLSHMTRP